jgi:hypothetical protein
MSPIKVAVAPGAGWSAEGAPSARDVAADSVSADAIEMETGIEIPALTVAERAVDMRKGNPRWRQFRRLEEEIPAIPMIARLLLGCFRTMGRFRGISMASHKSTLGNDESELKSHAIIAAGCKFF